MVYFDTKSYPLLVEIGFLLVATSWCAANLPLPPHLLTPPPPPPSQLPPPPAVALPPRPGGRSCVFPFWFRGGWRHTCVRYNLKGEEWCSLTVNFTRDENWMRCDGHDAKRFHCVVPFTYAGQRHYNCLPLSFVGGSGHWCGLQAEIPLGGVAWSTDNWAFCESTNATGRDYLQAVGPHRDLGTARLAALVKIARHRNAVKTEKAVVPVAAAAATVDNNDADSVGGGGSDGSGLGVGLVASLCVACGLLAGAVAAVACVTHRKYFRGKYKRIDPLLTSDAAEKSAYGGVEAYHD